jgi:hypothetical protein
MSRLAVPLRDPVRPPQYRPAGNFATSTSGSACGLAAKRLIAGWPVLARSGTHELQQLGLG